MTQPINKFRATVPRIPVADLTKTFEFYVGKLNFNPLYRIGEEAGVGRGEVIIRFCTGEPVQDESLGFYIEISDTDELFERYVKEGVTVRFEPEDMPWGSRDFGILDNNGYRLTFGNFRDISKRHKQTTQMVFAIQTMMAGDVDGLSRLLDADKELVNARALMKHRDDRQGTLLHCLIDYPNGHYPSNVLELAKILIKFGSDVESQDGGTTGSTPLQLLMGIDTPTPQETELTGLFLESGATFSKGNGDQHGMDAFSVALINGHTKCASMMFERGYPPNFAWAGAGLGNMNLVRSFFDENGYEDLPTNERAKSLGEHAQGSMNCAFLVAAINGQTQVSEYLLDKGMDIDLQPPGSDFAGIGATALHWATRNGHQETVELLVSKGANVLARDDVFQLTPAGWAAWYDHQDLKRFLQAKEQEN